MAPRRHHSRSASPPATAIRRHHSRSPSPPPSKKPATSSTAAAPSFASYLDTPNLPPTVRRLCHLVATVPPSSIPSAVSSLGSPISPSDLELTLKLSYSHPHSALALLRWAPLPRTPSPYAWNLAIDLLGKNRLFPLMWDTISHMRQLGILSLATFASVFSSYAAASDFTSALKTFDDMASTYSVTRDAAALNSLLSAVCRQGRPAVARDLLRLRRSEVPPDSDSYAILLEGWENEGDAKRARDTFEEMIDRVGWVPNNVPAYDSFLCTLVRGGGSGGLDDAVRYLSKLKEKRCYPGMKFFRMALEEFVRVEDAKGASAMWEMLVGKNGCYPDEKMYKEMIMLQCRGKEIEFALKYFDEMVVYGAFPDERTYNMLLKYLLKERKRRDAVAIFEEMVKNEFTPSEENCDLAIKFVLDAKEWEMGIKVWKCMVENGYAAEESGNALVGMLKDLDMLPEACKFAEDMIDRRVKLNSANLSKLRISLSKMGQGSIYYQILAKWKFH